MNSFDVEFCNKEFKFIEYINVFEADLYAEIEIFVSQVHYQGQSKVMFKLPHYSGEAFKKSGIFTSD